MMQLIFSKQACLDLEEIENHIAIDSKTHATDQIKKIIESVKRLQQFPNSGRMVPELEEPSVREIITGNYRVIYEIDKDEIHIQFIRHGKRDFPIP